ncbi:Phosphorylated adapter RNA export protein [Frankliniella fusca]|uniref:Phosphorylated adapter RNA export protein n=1 Tax=Frankliniella fusca TaxID=407009 RepID=A0AAE1GY86_9NEOP|nr:Phosphorylated adapter RNA export protein [Frankliniella fusca]
MDECEEGEILDFDDDDDVYRPLERPSRPDPTVQLQRPRIVESESDDVTDSSSDSDSSSSSGPRSAKKPKMHRVKPPHQSRRDGPPAGHSGARIRKNNVWTASIQEEAIINDLENIDGLQKFSRERGVESYDFTLNQERMSDDENASSNHEGSHQDQEPEAAVDEMSLDSNLDLRSKLSNKRRYEERGRVKQRLGRRPSPSDVDERLLEERFIKDLTKSDSESVDEVAHEMAKNLLETKEELILRIINTVGREKAVALYQKTQKIESEGGMLIMNGSRRRSPGGVFFFLVKNDDEISQDQRRIMFDEDSKATLKDIRKQRRAARQKTLEEERRKFADEISRKTDLPELLTRAELVVHGTAINSKNGDGSVSNPPPSPATDNRGESSNDSPPHNIQIQTSRNVAEYEDDFLDLHADDMDEF